MAASSDPPRWPDLETAATLAERSQMVARDIAGRGVRDAAVLRAMRDVPRHLFVPIGDQSQAYADQPLPIGLQQTISQPYVVAWMTELLLHGPNPDEPLPTPARILEVGTGSGYQTAVLACIVPAVFSIERHAPLQHQARQRLARLGLSNVHWREGDGSQGWPEAAPFDGILVAACAEKMPPSLLRQLSPENGRLVIPVIAGPGEQELFVVVRQGERWQTHGVGAVRFVPLVQPLESE